MPRIMEFLIFFVLFFGVYFLLHYYIYTRISKIFSFSYLWVIFLALSLMFPLSMILERMIYNGFTKALYYIGSTWFGVMFFLLFGFLILDLLRFAVKVNYPIGVIVVLVLVSLISLYSMVNANNIRITQIEVPIRNLPQSSIKIVQLSDVHIGSINTQAFLQKIVDKTNALNPDIVVITGDLFDGTDGLSADQIAPLKDLKAKTYFVTGNHENYLGKETAIKLIESMNVKVLQDEVVNVKGIQLIGLSYPDSETDRSQNKISQFKIGDEPKILLYHPPILQNGADLQLSGHTHNGQMFPFNFLVKIQFKYLYGLYKVNNTYIYTSSGAGTWGPPMRFLTNPEIAEITLRKTN